MSQAWAEPIRVSFAEAMRLTLLRNPDALVAVAEIARAGAIVEEVRAASLPTLNGTAAFTQLDSPRVSLVNNSSIIEPETQFNGAGTAALTLDPRRWVGWAQARENVRVTRLAAADVRRQLAVT